MRVASNQAVQLAINKKKLKKNYGNLLEKMKKNDIFTKKKISGNAQFSTQNQVKSNKKTQMFNFPRKFKRGAKKVTMPADVQFFSQNQMNSKKGHHVCGCPIFHAKASAKGHQVRKKMKKHKKKSGQPASSNLSCIFQR